jgi:uncharacterized repeat protein (TIGR02543 family)
LLLLKIFTIFARCYTQPQNKIKTQNTMKKFSFLASFLLMTATIFAGEMPSGYYDSANGKSGDELRSALKSIISDHTQIAYSSLPSQCYAASSEPSDFNGSGNVLEDIYSSKQYTSGDNGTTASDCGTGWNKEHSLPKSWFGGEEYPMYCDAFHIYPTDIKTNSNRAALPYGETNASLACSNYGYGAVGTSNRSGYTGEIFEPRETATTNYKGDLARTYFYMLTCYMNTNFTQAAGGQVMFTYTNSVADFTDYALDLMLEWHREDPVSEKERVRNNAIYAHQGNRNPFIDYPCLAEYIWGTKKGETVDFSKIVSSYDDNFANTENQCGCEITSTDPRITVSSKSVAFGAVEINSQNSQTITVKGSNLTDNISLAISGTNAGMFSLSNNSVSAGEEVTIIYTPTAEGTHTATLTLTSSGATSVEVTLTGSGAKKYTVTFDAGAGSCGTSSLTESSVSEGITLPTATAPSTCSDYIFAGWATTQVSETTTAPTLYAAFATYNPTSNCTLYAIYQKGGSNTKVTELNAGDIVVIYYPTDKMALTATASSSALSGVATTVEGNSITSLGSGAVKLIVETEGDNFRLRNGNDYLICPATGNGASFSTETGYADWTFVESDGVKYVKNVNAAYNSYPIYLEYYNSTFKAYTAKSFSSNYQFEFYKYEYSYTSAPSCQVCTLTGITLNTDAVTKTFTAGDEFSSKGLVATANYSDCDSRTITPTVTAPDMSSDGSKTVTISYTENGTTKSTSYTITVEPKPTYTITWSADGTKTQVTYNQGDALVLPTTPTACTGKQFIGWTATANYNNATTAPDDLFTEANGTVTASKTYYALFGSRTETTGETDIVTTLTMSDLGVTETSSVTESKTIDNFTITPSKADASNDPVYNVSGKDLRIYAKGTVEISSSENMTAIEFEISTQGRKRLTTITASEGSMTSVDSLLTRWEGSATSVTFTVGEKATLGSDGKNKAGQLCFTAVKVTTRGTGTITTIGDYTTTCTSTPVTTYNINISNPTTGGKATASATTAAEGDVITLTATPAAGYELTGWNAIDNTMGKVTVSNNQFTMPASDVAVSPQFAKIDYTISTNLTHVAASGDNATTTQIGTALGLNFKADQGYTLPDGITVKVGTTTLESSQYNWNQSSGQLTIGLSETLLGNIEITITANAQMFTIIFKNEDGTELQTSQVAYDETPVYNGATPAKESTAQYEYTFSGWNPTITPVTREATYTAQFTETLRTYYVLFADYDGTTLKEQYVEYGSSAVAPADPERDYYTFTGWSEDFSNITGELLVAAQYKAIDYSITANLSNVTAASSNPTSATIEDKELSFTFTAADGYELPDNVTITMGETTLVNETHYLWDKSKGSLEIILTNSGIQGNTIITIAATTKSYGVTLNKNEHGTDDGLVYIYYLGDIDEDNCMWIEPSEEKYALNGYFTEANGGSKVIDANDKLVAGVAGYTDSEGLWQHIGDDVTLYAQWSVKTYTVKFVDYDGTALSSQTIEHGSSAVAPADPQRTGYTFTGWDADFSSVTSNLTITAVYEENKPTAVAATTLAEPICHTTNSMLYVSNLQAGSHLALYDAAGRLIAQRRHCNETEHFLLPNGIYIIKIEANGQTLQIKAVK